MATDLIALVGFKGSGKDTVGGFLQEKGGHTPMSFAGAVKGALTQMFGWSSAMMAGLTPESRAWREQPDPYWSHHLGRPITPRLMMQEFATELVRGHLDTDFWIYRLRRDIEASSSPVVVTDARFPNEIAMIRDLGGRVIWVRRDPLPSYYEAALGFNQRHPLLRRLTLPFSSQLKNVHASERDWIGVEFDQVILNNGSLYDLKNAAQGLC